MDKDRIVGAAKDIAGKVEGAAGDIADNAKVSASGRAREAAGTMQNLYGQAKDTVRDASDAAASFASNAVEAGSDTYQQGARAVARQVSDNPLGALLLAGGIGFALGMLMKRPPPRRQRWPY